MKMTSATREVNGVTILDISGRITLDSGSAALRDAIHDLTSKGRKNILVNLAEITYIDSSGVGALVGAFTTVRQHGGQLKLLKLTQKVRDLLHLTNLHNFFEIKDDEAEAISSFTS